MPERAKVSVCFITYNHERFVRAALDSALAQRAPFPIEIVVGDDCSTDGTAAIVEDYARRYPDVVRVVTGPANVGVNANVARTLAACGGQYVAILEGDDLWTDPDKLRLQSEVLDGDPGCAICFHPAGAIDEDGRTLADSPFRIPRRRTVFTLVDLLVLGNIIPTCSTFFRNGLIDRLPDWYASRKIGDLPLHVLNARHGDIRLIDREMGAWRAHAGGVFSAQTNDTRSREVVELYSLLDAELGYRYHELIESSQSWWRAVEAYRVGDIGAARRFARKRLARRPYRSDSLKALLLWTAPPLYGRLARPVR